jgi:hypothetical protein
MVKFDRNAVMHIAIFAAKTHPMLKNERDMPAAFLRSGLTIRAITGVNRVDKTA